MVWISRNELSEAQDNAAEARGRRKRDGSHLMK